MRPLFRLGDLSRYHASTKHLCRQAAMEETENPFITPTPRSTYGSRRPNRSQKPFSRFAIATGIHFFIAILLVVGVFISQFSFLNWPGQTLWPLIVLLVATFGITIVAAQLWIRNLGWGIVHFVLSLTVSICTWGVCWYVVSARILIEM